MIQLVSAAPGVGMSYAALPQRLLPVYRADGPSDMARHLFALKQGLLDLEYFERARRLPPDFDKRVYDLHWRLRAQAALIIAVGCWA